MQGLHSQIKNRLIVLCEQIPEGNSLKRINSLSGFITGMIRKGSSYLPDIGSGLPQDIDANSKTVAAKRFVENKWIDLETHFLPYLTCFLRGILALTLLRTGIILVIDGSQIGKDNAALMISLVWCKRGIPICWYVKKGGKGHFKSEDHEKVLQDAIEILQGLLSDKIPVTVGYFGGTG